MKYKRNLVCLAVLLVACSMLPTQAATAAATPSPVSQSPSSASPDNKSAFPTTSAVTVQERFRTYTGPRTPAALKALFTDPVAANYRQLPEVVLSDGAALVYITVDVATQDNAAPNIALNGARLMSLSRIKPEELVVEVLPDTGVESASLVIMTGSTPLEIPITLARSLPPETDMSEQGFVTFLGPSGINSQPLFDLNGDGLRNYLDDYIFTANYLVRSLGKADSGENSRQSGPSMPHPGQVETLSADQQTTTSKNKDAQEPAASQTPYQKNLAKRNQLLREMRRRLNPASGSPAAPAVADPSPQ